MKSRKPASYFEARINKGKPVDLMHTDVGARIRAEIKRLEDEAKVKAANKVVKIRVGK